MRYYYYFIIMYFPNIESHNQISLLQNLLFDLWQNCTQLSDQNNQNEIENITHQFNNILQMLHSKFQIPSNKNIQETIYLSLLNNVLCLTCYVRDIHMGLGYRQLTYSMITKLYNYYPDLTKILVETMIQNHENHFGYGSWRDICDLCNFLKDNTSDGFDHSLIEFLITITNKHLQKSWTHFKTHQSCLSNIAKWIPRETSKKNNWIFQLLVLDWSKKNTHFLNHNKKNKSYYASILKSKTKYRQMVSTLTKSIQPIETILCAKNNELICPSNIPEGAMIKYWDVLFNQTNTFQEKYAQSIKHNVCSNNLSHYIKNMKNMSFYNHNIPSHSNIFFPAHLNYYVKNALRCIFTIEQYTNNILNCPRLTEEINVLHEKWTYILEKWSKYKFIKENYVAVVNIQIISFLDPSFHIAIAHACFIAQCSNIKRILFSAHDPIWINIEHAQNFVDMIRIIYNTLKNEILINTSLQQSIQIFGKDNPIVPIVVEQNGYCYMHNHSYDFNDFFSIMNSSRYNLIQNLLN